MDVMHAWRRVGLGLVLSSLTLASCGGTTPNALLLGNPSLNISVPLNVAACDAKGTCYALGTTGLDISPTAAAQKSHNGRNWQSVATPNAPSTQMSAGACWSNGCLFGGSDAAGDVIWSTNIDSSLERIATPRDGLGVAAISCFADLTCSVLDTNGNGNARLSVTRDGGISWSDPANLSWSTSTTALSLACSSVSRCVASGTTRQGVSDVATWASTDNAGLGWRVRQELSWTQIVNLTCASAHCVALATLNSGDNVVIGSNNHGAKWWRSVSQPFHSPGAMSCSTPTKCVAVGSSRVWLAQSHGNSWVKKNLKYVPDPFVTVGCGAKRCVAIDSQTTVLVKN